MQFIPQNANDLANEYMDRSEAAAEKNRVVVPMIETQLRRVFHHLWMVVTRIVRRNRLDSPDQHESVRNHTPEWKRSRALS